MAAGDAFDRFRLAKRHTVRYAFSISILGALRRFRAGPAIRHMSSALRVLAVVLLGCIPSFTAHAARIGILSNAWAAETAADYTSKIPGHVFTGVDVSGSIPPLATLLANFDVILLFEDGVFVNATALGDRVAEFANSGRAVVLGTFYDQDRSDALGGNTFPHGWGTLEAIDPDTTDGIGTAYAIRTLTAAGITSHPLTRGVTALAALRGNPGPYAGGNQPKPGTAVIAVWSQPNARGGLDPAIAYRQTGAACVIQIGIAPQYGVLPTFGTYGTDFSGDFYQVWKNAFDFGSRGCTDASIPTLSQWNYGLLALMIIGIAWRAEKRRKLSSYRIGC